MQPDDAHNEPCPARERGTDQIADQGDHGKCTLQVVADATTCPLADVATIIDTQAAALAGWDSGLCIVRVKANGDKRPEAIPDWGRLDHTTGQRGAGWKRMQTERPPREMVASSFADGHPGIGFVCGAVSGNLEVLEFEGRSVDEGVLDRFIDAVRNANLGDLVGRIRHGYYEQSPSGGIHLPYRISDAMVPGNTKLAGRLATADELAENPGDPVKGWIETRGQGGFVVCAPSHGPVHKSGKPYVLVDGGFATIATISHDERDGLIDLCRSLDVVPKEAKQVLPPPPAGERSRFTSFGRGHIGESWMNAVTEHLAADTSMLALLERYGWKHDSDNSDYAYVTRPGKDGGVSGFINGSDRLGVHSTSTPFDSHAGTNKCPTYDRLDVIAVYEYGGDRKVAARHIADQTGIMTAWKAEQAKARTVSRPTNVDPETGEILNDSTTTGADIEPVARATEDHDYQETTTTSTEIIVLPPPSNPMAVARVLLVGRRHTPTWALTLRHWRGSWMGWMGPRWEEVEDRTVRSTLYHQVEHAQYWHETKAMELRDWAPNRHKLVDLAEAVAAITHLPQSTQPPTWMEGETGPTTIVACQNGLLDIATRKLIDHTPLYFNEIAVPFDYDADALEPTVWLAFLEQLWPDDPESITLLAQWFGYIISGETNLQKILGILGPIRSGKGTICRVLKGLIGHRNVTAPTLSSFGQNFGMQDLIGKPVAIIGDVRLGGGESHAVVERLLSISGEDAITIDRKYRDPWTGQLPTRIMFVSNELPRFGDASGAIATRCLLLETRTSWLGQEDKALTAKLLNELPAILNWALDGLASLTEAGRFTEPQSSVDAVTALADLVSPISAFVRDRCHKSPLLEVSRDTLYQSWKSWAEDNGQRAGSAQTFGRNLRAVVPGLKTTRPRADDGERERKYIGLALKGEQ